MEFYIKLKDLSISDTEIMAHQSLIKNLWNNKDFIERVKKDVGEIWNILTKDEQTECLLLDFKTQ